MGLLGDNNLKIVVSLKDKATKNLEKLRDKIKKIDLKQIGVGMTAVGGIVAAGSYKFIKVASDAEETQSKFNTVFKGIEGDMNNWAENFAGNVGRAEQDVKAWSSGMSDILKPLGMTTDKAAEMSKEVVELALDIASFNNVQDAQVIHAFNSALTGERESLKTLGIVINEADVKQEAYSTGLAKVGEELTKEAKAQATINLLFKNSQDAQGDLMRTQDSYANKVKKLKAQLKNLSETIGDKLLPIITPLVAKISEITTKVAGWMDKNPELTKTIVLIVTAIGGLMLVLGPLLLILPGIVTAVGILGTAFTILMSPVGLIIAIIVSLIAIGVMLYKNWDEIKFAGERLRKYLIKAFGIIKTAWKSVFESMGTVFKTVWKGVKATIKTAINWYIDKLNWVIRKANSISSKVSKVPGVSIPVISEIPHLAKGGIIKKPTLAIIGEAGPEAVIPLKNGEIMIPQSRASDARGGSTFITNINNPVVRNDNDLDRIEYQIERVLRGIMLNNNIEA